MEPAKRGLRTLNCEPKLILSLSNCPPSGVCHSDRNLPNTAVPLVEHLGRVDTVIWCAEHRAEKRGHSCPLSLRDTSCCSGGAFSEHEGCFKLLVSFTSVRFLWVSAGDKAGLSFLVDSLFLISPRYINCHGLGRQGNSSALQVTFKLNLG